RLLHAPRNQAAGVAFCFVRLRPDGGPLSRQWPARTGRKPSRDGRRVWRAAFRLWDLPVFYREGRECNVNPETFLQLDRVIHEKGRLAIMSMLAASPALSFTELRDVLNMTD